MKSLFFLQIPVVDSASIATNTPAPVIEELKFIDLVFEREGRSGSNSWEDKTGVQRFTVEIVAENLQILGKRQDSAPAAQTQPNIQEIIPPDDGDLPF
jgi:hypothetical protein